MRCSGIRLLTLAVGATAIVSVVATSGAEASGRHVKKHHHRMNLDWTNSRDSGDARPAAPQRAWGFGGDDVCPGLARSFDCKIWPPPMYDDPDRKKSGSDGG
jgi:hypothetical protein